MNAVYVFNDFTNVLIVGLLIMTSCILSLLYAWVLYKKLKSIRVMDQKMADISKHIHDGAMTFMRREYRLIVLFAIIIGILLASLGFIPALKDAEGIGFRAAISFVIGALFSGLAGWFGMFAATKANARTTFLAKEKGMSESLNVAFSGGSILGLTVVGLGLFGLTFLTIFFYFIYGGTSTDALIQYRALYDAINTIAGYGLGASLIALFGRVGGGIFTKAADVGADLIGKIESDIPEDDARNPAVIADNVGDNVGDIAGMGSDLTESYVGSIISALTLGIYGFVVFSPEMVFQGDVVFVDGRIVSTLIAQVLFPLLIAGLGVLSTICSVMLVRSKSWKQPKVALDTSFYLSVGFMFICAFFLSLWMFDGVRSFQLFGAVAVGLLVGMAIGSIASLYTSLDSKHVLNVAKQSETGHATNVIAGFGVGMKSTFLTIIALVAGITFAYLFTKDMYGVALAAVGMLSTAGMTISVDAYGPIADNAGGIAEMTHQEKHVRDITDHLDSVGNTTAAIGKGFCIGSAALTSIGLFFAFEKSAGLSFEQGINILEPGVLVGVFIGAMLPYLFTSLVIASVGKAASQMIDDVRLQYKENPGIMKGDMLPDYNRCVDIATKAALREMILPGMIAIFSPIIAGLLLGAKGLGGLLVGGLVSSMMLAIFMANSGGAWDNAKKWIESGHLGGKGSQAHKASVTGDTVGDPFKDTAGPSMDILIKLMSIVSLMIVPLLSEIEPLLKFLFN